LITCPNCAWQNVAGARFCENCGADLQVLNRSNPPAAQSWPEPPRQPFTNSAVEEDPTSPTWRMSPLPVEEAPVPKRRLWIWVLVIALLGCLTICVLSFTWLEHTDSGRSFQTRVAEEETTQAGD
jgi:hypothetical protein